MNFQKFKTLVNILIGSFGIWMCQRGQHHQIVPPPPLTLLICEGAIYPPHPHCWLSLLEFGMLKREEKQRFTPQEYVTSCGCESLLLQHFPSLGSFSSACTLPHVSPLPPKFSPFHPPFPPALVPPFVQCRASIRFLQIYI
jgi:hypothetical protein